MTTTFEFGSPCWSGFRAADVASSTAFYAGLFDWEPTEIENGYVVFSLGEAAVAGGGPLIHGDQLPAWCTYMKVADADASVGAALAQGATVMIDPFDVPGQGRVGVIHDPGGAELWIWQPFGFEGAERYGEPGGICGQDLVTTDLDTARDFYRSVFGAKAAARCRTRGSAADATSAEWLVTFGVDNVAAAADRANGLGGDVETLTDDAAEIIDPEGCRFALCRMATREADSIRET